MIDMSRFTNNVAKDNSIIVNGTEFMVSDKTAEAIMELINGKKLTAPQTAQTTERPKVNAAVETTCSDVKCKWAVEEVIANGKKFYRIVDGIFTYGRWFPSKTNPNEEIRGRMNLEAHKIATETVKGLEGIKSVEMDGGWKAYGFTTKKSAEKALEKLPERIQGVQIAEYISKYGLIKFDWAVRDAKTGKRIK